MIQFAARKLIHLRSDFYAFRPALGKAAGSASWSPEALFCFYACADRGSFETHDATAKGDDRLGVARGGAHARLPVGVR